MKRYTLCTVILSSVICYTSGCGKTDYDTKYMIDYADCVNSGGEYIKTTDDIAVCFCKNEPCYGNICNEKTKECGVCTDGEEKCDTNNGSYLICEGKKWQNTGKICNIGDSQKTEECQKENLTKSCDGNKLVVKCNEAILYDVQCQKCSDGECVDECNWNSPKCADNSNYLEICNEGKVEKIFCPFGCDNKNNECMFSKTSTCNNGEWKCEVNSLNHPVLYQCTNNIWEVERICEYDTCDVQKKSCGCTVNTMICSDDGQFVMSCKESAISGYTTKEEITKCNNGCKDGECKCEEGSSRCIDNHAETCTDGKWQEPVQCELYCANGECKECYPEEKKCEDSRIMTCNSNGHWESKKCEFGCNLERNECNICEDGASRIKNNYLLTCQNGQWLQDLYCEFGFNEDKTCKCEENIIKCEGSNAIQCINGMWQTNPCPLGCQNGSCNECSETDTPRCANKHIERCVNGKWAQDVNECNICLNGKCTDCYPGTKQCVDSVQSECDASGSWSIINKCDLGCTENECKDCEYNENQAITSCRDNKLFVCTNKNKWELKDDCNSMGCDFQDTIAKCKECNIENATECTPNGYKKCLNGFWRDIECTDGQFCSIINNSVNCVECNDGEATTTDNQFKICESGFWTIPKEILFDCDEEHCYLMFNNVPVLQTGTTNILPLETNSVLNRSIESSSLIVTPDTICVDNFAYNEDKLLGAYSLSFNKKKQLMIKYCGKCNEEHTKCEECLSIDGVKNYMVDHNIPAVCINSTWFRREGIRLHSCDAIKHDHYLYYSKFYLDPISIELLNPRLCESLHTTSNNTFELDYSNSDDSIIGCYDPITAQTPSLYIYKENSSYKAISCGFLNVSSNKESKRTPYLCNNEYTRCENDDGCTEYHEIHKDKSELCHNRQLIPVSHCEIKTIGVSRQFLNCIFNKEIHNNICIDYYETDTAPISFTFDSSKRISDGENLSYQSITCNKGCNSDYTGCM